MLQSSLDSASGATRFDADSRLVEALRAGHPSAAEELVDRYGARVYRLAIRVTGVREDAEEATQDALLLAARKIHTFKGESAFGSWLYRIAINAAYARLRVRRRTAPEIALDDVLPPLVADGRFAAMEDWSKEVDDRALQVELREVLTTAIGALPADHRVMLALHDIEGMSSRELAEALGVTVPAVKSRLHRSRLAVRKRLADYLGRHELGAIR